MLKLRKIGDPNGSRLSHLLTELAKKISNSLGDPGERATEVPGLMLYRRTGPTVPNPSTYEPSLLVIAQGRIRVDLGQASYVFGQSRFLVTSLELPVMSQVITASEKAPYLAFFLKLDMSTARDISFFSKLIQREIIYRLLQGSLGARLRAIATFETKCHRTAKAVAWLRSNYEKPLRVEHLATIAGMSRSTLHLHFRALTAMSPLQFQKQLRLHAARQRILTGGLDAASAAFDVGYESPSQFNREYRRFFGQPPIRDIKALRDGKVVAITTA